MKQIRRAVTCPYAHYMVQAEAAQQVAKLAVAGYTESVTGAERKQ